MRDGCQQTASRSPNDKVVSGLAGGCSRTERASSASAGSAPFFESCSREGIGNYLLRYGLGYHAS